MEIKKSHGLQIAEKVIRRVANRIKESDLDCEIYVDTFNNCRETGYVYKVYRKNKQLYIWTFEHRMSDDIIKVVSFREGSCDKNNMFDDESYVNGYQHYKPNEIKVLADDIARLICDFADGEYDEEA